MADVLQSVVGGADGCIFSFGHTSLGKCCHSCAPMLPSSCPPPPAGALLPSLSLALLEVLHVDVGVGISQQSWGRQSQKAEASEWLGVVSRPSGLALGPWARF